MIKRKEKHIIPYSVAYIYTQTTNTVVVKGLHRSGCHH